MAEAVVRYEPLYPDVRSPSRATAHSAGFDLHVYLKGRAVTIRDAAGEERVRELPAADDATLRLLAGDTALLPLGFRARLPEGYEAQIRMRSSWAFKYGLTLPNAPGTIDADYPDEWLVMMRAAREVDIRHGDRIAQAVIARFHPLAWEPGRVGISSDRTGGFGSTG